jgi:hypothetical protein
MKQTLSLLGITMFAIPLLAADNNNDIKAAAEKLGKNYSWRTTVAAPEAGGGGRFRPGPTEGKSDDGTLMLSMTRGDNTTEAVIKGDKTVVKVEGEWKTLEDLAQDGQGPGRFIGFILRGYKAPAADAPDIAARTKELKKEGDVYSGELTDEGAKSLLMFRGGRGGGGQGNAPTPGKASGSVKFWVKDGKLSKYEYKVSGTITFNGEDRDIDRTTTVEIKEVGSTKINIPDEAKKKLS